MARRGRGKGLEPRIPTKPAASVKQAVAPAPAFVMPGTTPDLTGIDLSNVQAPIPQLQQQTAPPPPELVPAVEQAPVPVPQIDPAVLAQIQQQFNLPAPVAPPAPGRAERTSSIGPVRLRFRVGLAASKSSARGRCALKLPRHRCLLQ